MATPMLLPFIVFVLAGRGLMMVKFSCLEQIIACLVAAIAALASMYFAWFCITFCIFECPRQWDSRDWLTLLLPIATIVLFGGMAVRKLIAGRRRYTAAIAAVQVPYVAMMVTVPVVYYHDKWEADAYLFLATAAAYVVCLTYWSLKSPDTRRAQIAAASGAPAQDEAIGVSRRDARGA